MSKKDKHRSVQMTNDSSIVSKCSMASRGYVTDDFTKLFVAKCARRSPLINRGYYVRAKCMSLLFKSYCDFFKGKSPCQVLSLGAGYDANFFRLKAAGTLPDGCRYFEVDLPSVAANKREIIESSADLSSLAGRSTTSGPQVQYCLMGQDICDLDGLELALRDSGINFHAPTLVFAECVLSYLDTMHSDRLIEWISSKFDDVALAVYEQVESRDAFAIVMLGHFESLGSPLKSLQKYPDIRSLISRYLTRGFEACDCVSMDEFVSRLDPKEALRFQNLEPFDEFEEWHEKCAHYAISLSGKGSTFGAFPAAFTQRDMRVRGHVSQLAQADWTLHSVESCLRRFGHSSVVTIDGKIMTVGGFAENGGKHSRVFAPVLTDPETFPSEPVSACLEGRQHFAMLCLDNGCILVNGGRTSPLRACDSDVFLCPSNGSYIVKELHFKSTPPPRWRHTLTKLKSVEGSEKVVLFGGRTPNDAVLNDCYVLDVSTCTWSSVTENATSPLPRHSHAAVAAYDDSSVIITCGLSGNEQPLNCIYNFNINTLSWQELPVDGLLPRFSHTAHLADPNTVVLVGGVSGSCGKPCGLAVINLTSMSCREVQLPGQDPARPFMTFGHSSVLIGDTNEGSKILMIGGGGNCFSFGTHFNRHIAVIELRTLSKYMS